MIGDHDEFRMPWAYYRLGSLHLHDAEFLMQTDGQDSVVLQMERGSSPWAPGPTGTYRLSFRGLLSASLWKNDGRRVALADCELDRRRCWLDARVIDWNVNPPHVKYEICVNEGVIQMACTTVHLTTFPVHTPAELTALVASLTGRKLSRVSNPPRSALVWCDFKDIEDDSVVSIGLNCNFRIRSRQSHVPADRSALLCSHEETDRYHPECSGGRGWDFGDVADVRATSVEVACGSIVSTEAQVISASVGAEAGLRIALSDAASGCMPSSEWLIEAEFANDPQYPDAGSTDWWAIHHESDSQLVTPLEPSSPGGEP